MKSIYVCVCITLLAAPSCKKAYDYIRDHPDDQIPFCRITQIRGLGYFVYDFPDTLTFYYNSKGDPVDMLDRSIAPHSQDQHWRYDNRGRLIGYYITLPPPIGTPTGAIIYDKYGYPRPDWVTDTMFEYSTVDFPPTYKFNNNSATIYAYQLDNKGRIIKRYNIDDPHQPPQLVSEYDYDSNGNLVFPYPGVTYDHMLNPYRTSRVFQFTYKDYSLNNLIAVNPASSGGIVPAYDQYGLPVTLPGILDITYYPLPFDAMSSNPIYIDYACSAPKGPINY